MQELSLSVADACCCRHSVNCGHTKTTASLAAWACTALYCKPLAKHGIHFKVLLRLCVRAVTPAIIDKLRSAFFAASPEGAITQQQFQDVLSSLGIESVPAGRMFDAFDSNGDHRVDYKEFLCGLAALHGGGEDALRCT